MVNKHCLHTLQPEVVHLLCVTYLHKLSLIIHDKINTEDKTDMLLYSLSCSAVVSPDG